MSVDDITLSCSNEVAVKTKRSFDLTDQQLAFITKEAKRLGVSLSEALRAIIDKARGV